MPKMHRKCEWGHASEISLCPGATSVMPLRAAVQKGPTLVGPSSRSVVAVCPFGRYFAPAAVDTESTCSRPRFFRIALMHSRHTVASRAGAARAMNISEIGQCFAIM